MIFENNEQIIKELKKLMIENDTSQREIAEKLEIKPQGLTKILNKKNFSFEDAQKIVAAMNCEMDVTFRKK